MSGAAASTAWEAPVAAWDPAARRMRFRHGPIELIIAADGGAQALRAALKAAWARFETLLPELVGELPRLRQGADAAAAPFDGAVARRMAEAVAPHASESFVTPMAAVAGAVADEILAVMRDSGGLSRIAVNNGGDIAMFLAPGETYAFAMAEARGADLGAARISSDDLTNCVGGLATSGWRGRSFSLGVADSVTVFAESAAAADVAATLIANAVDLPDHLGVRREPASDLAPDSDLGARLVTVAVPDFTAEERRTALAAGLARAERMRTAEAINAAALFLGDDAVAAGAFAGAAQQLELKRSMTGKAA